MGNLEYLISGGKGMKVRIRRGGGGLWDLFMCISLSLSLFFDIMFICI